MTIDAHDQVIADARTWVPVGLMLAVIVVAGFAAAITGIYSNRASKVAKEVARRTVELRAANEELREEVARRRTAEERLARTQADLEKEVARRTTQLRSTSNQLRSILESEPECVKILSADGLLEDMNAAGLGMIEADSLEEVIGCDVYALVADEHRDAFIDLNRRVIAGERVTLEFEIVGLKGTRRWVETHAAPLYDPDGQSARHLAITRDITARKRAEEERGRLEAQLRHSQKLESVGVLAGGIAHDFNNMLQVVIGNCEIALQQDSLNDFTRESLEASHKAALHASRVCDQMLTYAGRSRSVVEPVHLSLLANSMMDLLKTTHSKNTLFELHADDDGVLIQGDEAQLSQVLMNLITNASESIHEGRGKIAVSIRSVAVGPDASRHGWVGTIPAPGSYVALEVVDNGCGMDAATIERMFDPYFTTKFTGRGLGLSASLGIIQSHDGCIRVSSEPGEGTRMTVAFPAIENKGQAQLPDSEEPLPRQQSFIDTTVLVVDDDQSVLAIGDAILRRLGCHTMLASDGEEAIERFRQDMGSIDAVLLDVTMPRLDGNEACAVMRNLRPDIPVVFCSGYADDAIKPSVDTGAFTGFLHKPYRKDELARILTEALAA